MKDLAIILNLAERNINHIPAVHLLDALFIGNQYRGSYMSDHFICNLLNEPLASLINLI